MVYITGDIHGDVTPIQTLFEKHRPREKDIIVILGDVALNYTGRLRDRIMKEELSVFTLKIQAVLALHLSSCTCNHEENMV